MGFLNDVFGIGGSSKQRVTEQEYKKVKSALWSEGFSQRERDKIDDIFAPDFKMQETSSHPRGLEASEIDARIKWMKENKSKHGFSDGKINEIEATLKRKL